MDLLYTVNCICHYILLIIGKNATPAKKTLSSIKKPSSTRKTPTAKKDAPTGIKKERTSAAKKDTPSSTKKDTPSKKASDRKKGSATPSKEGGGTPVKGKKKEEEKEVWRWWDEEPHPEGVKWLTLEHKVRNCAWFVGMVYLIFYRALTLLHHMRDCLLMLSFITMVRHYSDCVQYRVLPTKQPMVVLVCTVSSFHYC